MPSSFRNTFLLPLFVIALVSLATVFKIADLDFWWHLKTGQVILQQHAFQHTEIYSYTAIGREYIDHEWLFQVFSYLAYLAGGTAGVIFMKTSILVVVYLLIAYHLKQNGASQGIICLLLMLSVCAAVQRFIERPEIFSILYLTAIVLCLDRYLKRNSLLALVLIPLIILIWSNTHAAVILGLLVQGLFIAGLVLQSALQRHGIQPYYENAGTRQIATIAALLVVSFLVTGVNPYGFRLLAVPFELTGIIDSGLLKNEEWQRTLPQKLPLFYVALIFGLGMHAANFRRLSPVHFLLTALFGWLAVRYVRNTGMFAVLMPLALAPYAGRLSLKSQWIGAANVVAAIATLFVMTLAFPFQRGLGISSGFPEKIAEFTVQKNLSGNLLNSYGFGGYLIWKLFPERKIFIDGRNEVYLPLLKEIVESRADSRKWTMLLEKYKVEYALLNYVEELEKVTIVQPDHKLDVVYMPFSSTHFPRSRWALVYFDDAGMILVRRKGMNSRLLSQEYTSVFPEGDGYQEALIQKGTVPRDKVISELRRKLAEDPDCSRA